MATIIYLVRHGTYQNPKGIMTFRLPGYALNDQGEQESQKMADFFKKNSPITKIYSSPLLRTRQTAQIIAKSLNLKVLVNSLLIEVESPFFKGMKKKDYDQNYSGDIYCQKEHLSGGGESIKQINERMTKFVQKVLKENPNGKIITVSHGDPIMICVNMLIKGKVERPLSKRKDYIPMGGIIKLVFDENKKLESFDRISLG